MGAPRTWETENPPGVAGSTSEGEDERMESVVGVDGEGEVDGKRGVVGEDVYESVPREGSDAM